MIKAAIIGTGQIARQHLECLGQLPGVSVAAVCDLSAVMAESTAERLGVGAWFTDHQRMLREVKPDVVHVTTPPNTHYRLAMECLEAGGHVLVEKPVTTTYAELRRLMEAAQARGKVLQEDQNYLFNRDIQSVLGLIATGEFGEVTHVEVMICLSILGPGSRWTDRNAPHPILKMPGGAIADFLPHLAYLAYAFVGGHRRVRTLWSKRDAGTPLPSDEFRALLECERGSAVLAFSAHAQPDLFAVRVYGTKMRAAVNLWEPRLTLECMRSGPKPLMPVFNGLAEARVARRAALGGLWRKLSGGAGPYEGMWALIGRVYQAIGSGGPPPVPAAQMETVGRLVEELTQEERSL